MRFKDDIEALLSQLSAKERAQIEKMLSSKRAYQLNHAQNSICELMKNYKVDEIKTLCKSHGIKGYSNLNKDTLLIHFITNLVTEDYLDEMVATFNKAQKLAFVIASQFSAWQAPLPTRLHFENNFVLFHFSGEDGYYLTWIPDEVSNIVEKYIDSHTELKQLKLAYALLEAASNLYGLYSFTQLQRVYEVYLNKSYSLLDIQKWLKQIELVNPEMTNFRVFNGLIASKGLEFEEDEYHYFVKDAKYYMPDTTQEILSYQELIYGIDDEAEIKFMNWLEQNILKDNHFEAEVTSLSGEILTMMKHAMTYDMVQDVLQSLVQDGILRKRVEFTAENVVKPIYMKMRNWIYHGYTFEEYMNLMDKDEHEQRNNVIDLKQYRK
ncbi:hypothetical protein [Staphylococcus felis]|uniref:hypothetical protein n=1 Tax=Staphylococcus felis TaxID=46127 RepID=UPI0024815A3A|nr:hypothetical protein [Staphylococcus felis]MDQ7192809.1 hypothetical protein [Staphylococcus felis]